jgi:hypothetical protein
MTPYRRIRCSGVGEGVTPLLAYHGDPKLKRHYLSRVRAHEKADEIVQAYAYWKGGKGCAVGCTLHSNRHSQYPIELGIPEELAHLEDHFFESLPVGIAKKWPARFLSAINPGADLSRVYDLWSAWNLIDPLHGVIVCVTNDFLEVQKIVRETAEACLSGHRIDFAEAARAAGAAGAAWAARAAGAAWAAEAAGAAWAAWAAEAARAARAARAAEAARAAGAARAARAAYYNKSSDKLIELLEAA